MREFKYLNEPCLLVQMKVNAKLCIHMITFFSKSLHTYCKLLKIDLVHEIYNKIVTPCFDS